MKLKDYVWLFTPLILYMLPYLASVNVAFPMVAISPFMLIIMMNLASAKEAFNFREFGMHNLYIASAMIFAVNNKFLQGLAVFIVLTFYFHAVIDIKKMNFAILDRYGKMFAVGIAILFFGVIFLPIFSRYSFTLGSWYFVAAEDIPLVRTTIDGPLMIIILTTCIYLNIKYNPKRFGKVAFWVIIIAFLFYTALVFNRRTVISLFLLMFPLVFFGFIPQRRIYIGMFLCTFLLPIFFGIFLTYAKELSTIPIINQITMRSNDLNADDNQRLIGWTQAIKAYQHAGFEDFFSFHKVLIRSDDSRYNHFHNGYIQLFYEQGIFGFCTVILVMLKTLSSLKYFKYINIKQHKYIFVFPVIFFLVTFLCITESAFRRISILNLLFLSSSFVIVKIGQYIKVNFNFIIKE